MLEKRNVNSNATTSTIKKKQNQENLPIFSIVEAITGKSVASDFTRRQEP